MSLPKPLEFYFDVPLYKPYNISFEDTNEIYNILFYTSRIDAYCTRCEKESTFTPVNNYPFADKPHLYYNFDNKNTYFERLITNSYTYELKFKCTRCGFHNLSYNFFILDIRNIISCDPPKTERKTELIKVGQYPSIADLNNNDIVKYRKLLNKEKYNELNKAIGLSSHGIGIGSFVYLRRIFEDLIESAFSKSQLEEEHFRKARMDEKIQLLKDFLPVFLIENKSLYRILSKGIHELSEDECLSMFHIVKVGIELILDEKLEEYEKQKKIEEAKKALLKLNERLNS